MWIYIVIAVIVIIVFYAFITYNNFIKLKNMVKEAFATMDVYLKKRWDLIPNIVETVKGYAEHEESTLEIVVMTVCLMKKKLKQIKRYQKILTK